MAIFTEKWFEIKCWGKSRAESERNGLAFVEREPGNCQSGYLRAAIYGQGITGPGMAGLPGITMLGVPGESPMAGVPGMTVSGVAGVSGAKQIAEDAELAKVGG
jgi:hypothetical protein